MELTGILNAPQKPIAAASLPLERLSFTETTTFSLGSSAKLLYLPFVRFFEISSESLMKQQRIQVKTRAANDKQLVATKCCV